jgi:hypothetical protein
MQMTLPCDHFHTQPQWQWFFLQRSPFVQQLKNFPGSYGSQWPTVMFRKISRLVSVRPNGLFPSVLPSKIMYAFVRSEVFTPVPMKNGVFWDVTSCGFVRTNVSEELRAYFIRVTRIGVLGTTQTVTSNRRTLRRNTGSYKNQTA